MKRHRAFKLDEFAKVVPADERLKEAFSKYDQTDMNPSVRIKYINAKKFGDIQMKERALYDLLEDRQLLKKMGIVKS